MRVLLLFIFVIARETLCQVCDENQDTVELIDRKHNGITYEDGEYFVDNTTGTKLGCVCMKKICLRKCCDFGEAYDLSVFQCVNSTLNFDPPVWESEWSDEINADVKFDYYKFSMRCATDPKEDLKLVSHFTNHSRLLKDGRLYFYVEEDKSPNFYYNNSKYCLENFIQEDKTVKLDALFCFVAYTEPHHLELSATCMLVSCIFFILTVAVYLFLPDLRNSVHGRVMIAYLMSFFVDFLFMATMQILLLMDNMTKIQCVTFTFIICFAMQSGFFWLNVMCYDLWSKFKKVNVTTHGYSSEDRIKFLWYCAYAFGIPTALTGLMAALEFSEIKYHKCLPNIRRNGCFIRDLSKFIYLYMPMLIVLVVNVIFIVLLTMRIMHIKKQTQRLQKKDSQRFALYIKLFVVSGINWIFEAISSFYPQQEIWWRIPDAYNVLLGVIIFIIFVAKKSTLVDIKNRYKQLRGEKFSRAAKTSPSAGTQETVVMKSASSIENIVEKNK